MNSEVLALVALVLAAIPAVMTLLNLSVYRLLPKRVPEAETAVSVLIPARNEELNIRSAIEAVLKNQGVEIELIVLDDHSTDTTAELVRQAAHDDPRVRLEHAPPLPAGWCGKQHACHVLAGHARHPLLVFVDADVRLAPDALRRMVDLMARDGAPALASGFPRQVVGTFSERLLLPMIHFILLGWLPMHLMKRSLRPSLSAGCGQLFIARREAYEQAGGHSMIRDSLHDGVKLPRLFRRAGFMTGLFDATDVATCRMYRTNAEVWQGLGKNATEGIGAPGTIVPMSLLLVGGQVLPFVLWATMADPGQVVRLAVWLALLPRMIGVVRFGQPMLSALLHPVGILALLWIQWQALFFRLLGRPSEWKTRSYPHPDAEPAFSREFSEQGAVEEETR
jgi:glycosyltransferase involved in cell wall biosynthesis